MFSRAGRWTDIDESGCGEASSAAVARLLSSTLVGWKSPGPPRERLGTAGKLALLAILAGALALRLWGLGYGLPHTLARPDEQTLLDVLAKFDTGDLNPHWFMY